MLWLALNHFICPFCDFLNGIMISLGTNHRFIFVKMLGLSTKGSFNFPSVDFKIALFKLWMLKVQTLNSQRMNVCLFEFHVVTSHPKKTNNDPQSCVSYGF